MSFEQILEQNGYLVYRNVGDSMWPLIRQGKDLVVINPKPEGRLKRYDVPLYQRDCDRLCDNGKYILHRIIRVKKDRYLIAGDNRWNVERDIDDTHIIGVLTAVIRGGADPHIEHPETLYVTDLSYKLYTHLWCDLFPVRAILFWLRDLPRRSLRFILPLLRH